VAATFKHFFEHRLLGRKVGLVVEQVDRAARQRLFRRAGCLPALPANRLGRAKDLALAEIRKKALWLSVLVLHTLHVALVAQRVEAGAHVLRDVLAAVFKRDDFGVEAAFRSLFCVSCCCRR